MNQARSASYTTARSNMVDGQLRPNRITDKLLLNRFEALPRELFVPVAQQATAHVDAPQPLGEGREMFSPMVLAHLLQALQLTPDDTLLVVAAGSGYSAAVASGLVTEVVAVEDDKKLVVQAKNTLLDLNITNVRLLQGEPQHGAARHAPFAAILVDAPVSEVPAGLWDQLADGGRLAAVTPGSDGIMEARVWAKHGGTTFETTLFETKGHMLPAMRMAERFVF